MRKRSQDRHWFLVGIMAEFKPTLSQTYRRTKPQAAPARAAGSGIRPYPHLQSGICGELLNQRESDFLLFHACIQQLEDSRSRRIESEHAARRISRTTAPSPVCVVRTLSESRIIGSPVDKLPRYSAYSATIPRFLPVNAPDIRITNNSAEDTSSEIAGGDKLNLKPKATSTNR